MDQPSFQKICICGAGTMGRGIAQVSAQNGFDTVLYDVEATILEQARISVQQNLAMLIDKGRINPEQKKSTLGKLQFSNNILDCTADLVIEAIIEKLEAKISLFNQIGAINTTKTILATNTSSLSISSIAERVENPERVVGFHFFNPATIMKLVEVVKGKQTSEQTIQTIFTIAKQLNKTPVLCMDSPGFIVNHVARPYYIESLRMIEEGLCDFSTIDALLESTGFKMGPFKLMDLIGNDINFAVSCSVYEQLGKPPRLKPSLIQEEKVKRGELGRKSGIGYYNYSHPVS